MAEATAASLSDVSQLDVVGVVTSREDALARAFEVDLVLADLHLGGRHGAVELCRRLSELDAAPVVLVLVEDHDQDNLLPVLEVGAAGFVSHEGGLSELVGSTLAALRGEACVPRRLLGNVLRGLVERRRQSDVIQQRIASLSPREREILELLGQGLGHTEIAARLFISPQTARAHIQRVLKKLDVHSRVEAAALAAELETLTARRLA